MAISKILVAGPFASGKTTFIKMLTKEKALGTEKKIFHNEEKKTKSTTTVAMDFGEYSYNGEKIAIFGIPGQERFAFMWPVLAKNAAGIIYLLDSADEKYWYQLFEQINTFRKVGLKVPFIIGANKQDLPNAKTPEEIRKKLKLPEWVKIVPLVAFDREQVEETLKVLLEEIEKYGTLEAQKEQVAV